MKTAKQFLYTLAYMFLAARIGIACSCINANFDEIRRNADAAFIGRVASLVGDDGVRFRNVTFQVIQGLRSILTETVTILTESEQSSCRYSFEVGKAYRIYAQRLPDGNLYTGFCSGNSLKQSLNQATGISSRVNYKAVFAATLCIIMFVGFGFFLLRLINNMTS